MNDTRAVGQELQDHVLGVARKGRDRVTSTVKTVTTAAQHIRPQLHNLPRPNLTRPTLLTPAQLREKAPALVAMLPTPDQLKASAHEFAGHARSVQRLVLGQVRTVTGPLAHQAAARLAKVGQPAPAQPAKDQPEQAETTTRVSEVKVDHAAPTNGEDTAKVKVGHAASGQHKTKPKVRPSAK